MLADQFRNPEPLRLVGQLIRREVARPRREVLADGPLQGLDVHLFEGGNRYVFGEGEVVLIGLDEREELAMVDEIDLVDHQKDRGLHVLELLQDELIARELVRARRLSHQQDQIDTLIGVTRNLHHMTIERAARPRQPRRIDEDQLGLRGRLDTGDPAARGLGLGRDNGDLLAHQGIQQRGFADIWAAQKRDKA